MEYIVNVRSMMVPMPDHTSRKRRAYQRMQQRLDQAELMGKRMVPVAWLRTMRAAGLIAPSHVHSF